MPLLQQLKQVSAQTLRKLRGPKAPPPDCSAEELATIDRVRPYTKTSLERLLCCIQSTEYIVKQGIEGAIVECGVYKGGSMMAIADTLVRLGTRDRDLYLYDTFEGMGAPAPEDVTYHGKSAIEESKHHTEWCYCSLQDVQSNLAHIDYPASKTHFIKGFVEDTIPSQCPERIALLRLDTDWYESTRHELEHLFPRLAVGGVLIIDDYGHWQGARQAVDEFIAHNNIRICLHRTDYTGRVAVKQG